jgi:NTP pyrophosphatase (non-canonical NTP hydrolase)
MIPIEEKNLYMDAVLTFGEDSQMNMLTEEVGELLVALNKFRRNGDPENLIEELADVQIMISQITIMIGATHEVEEVIGRKLLRLRDRLEKYKTRAI